VISEKPALVDCGAREDWVDVDRVVNRAVEKEKPYDRTANFIVTVHQTITLMQKGSSGPTKKCLSPSRQSACRIHRRERKVSRHVSGSFAHIVPVRIPDNDFKR